MRKGLTVIEVLFALAIITIAVSVILLSLPKLNSKKIVEKSAENVVSIIDQARSLTLSSVGAIQYGVNIEQTRVTLFQGSTYSSSDPDNVVTNLDSRVRIGSITLNGGGTSVVFERLTGRVDAQGTFELYLDSDPTISKTVNINGTGVVEIES